VNEPRAVVTVLPQKPPTNKKPKRTLISYTYHPESRTFTIPVASLMQMIKDINDNKEKP
jgi:hypothetical protein